MLSLSIASAASASLLLASWGAPVWAQSPNPYGPGGLPVVIPSLQFTQPDGSRPSPYGLYGPVTPAWPAPQPAEPLKLCPGVLCRPGCFDSFCR